MDSIDAVATNDHIVVQETIQSDLMKPIDTIIDTIEVFVEKNPHVSLCSEEDRENITQLISDMGKHGKFFLLFHAKKYYKIGDKIQHVPPLKFLGVIFSNPELKEAMHTILGDYFKRKNLLGGLLPGLELAVQEKGFEREFQAFCKEIQVPIEELMAFRNEGKWKEMVAYLTER